MSNKWLKAKVLDSETGWKLQGLQTYESCNLSQAYICMITTEKMGRSYLVRKSTI